MKKYCLCVTIDREICKPKFFNTEEEAYVDMKQILIDEILNRNCEEDYLDENYELIEDECEGAASSGIFEIAEGFMYSNLDDDYPIDTKIFEVEL